MIRKKILRIYDILLIEMKETIKHMWKYLVSNSDFSFRSGLKRWPIFEASFRDDYRPTK